MQREAAAERAESLRKWAQGLQDAQLERGVPHATQAQEWRGATVQGAHPLNINPVGVRKEAVEHGVVLWEPFAGAGCSDWWRVWRRGSQSRATSGMTPVP